MDELNDRIGQLPPLKRALLALEELQAKVEALENQQHEPIAIIGLGCRFPGAANPQAYWKLLHDGVDAIREVPPDRWDNEVFYDPAPGTPGKTITRFGGFLDQVDLFDPLFFGISPREAARMDPQQRLLLEVTWEALENAGQPLDRLAGTKTGVYIGISNNDYSIYQFTDLNQIDAYAGTGNAFSIAANRLSYTFDLHGPSVAIDTACSSSLVAVHLAVNSLRQRESNLAIAGGVNLILSPELTITFSQAHMMAADGRCKSFDAAADGYGRGEGCGIVVLKRLQDAIQDGDQILAVVYGTAVNQDGRSNGLTAPNGSAHQTVIREAIKDAGILPEQIDYIEAHGTGTILGDPIEMRALGSVMQARPPSSTCLVGTVKTNIGHLEAASGVASLIKVILSLHNSEIPANLHFKKINPYINLENSPLVIPTNLTPWERSPGLARYAGVNSFGFGGTNAHIILGDAPQAPSQPEASAPTEVAAASLAVDEIGRALSLLAASSSYQVFVLTLSAKSEAGLVQVVQGYSDLVQRLFEEQKALHELQAERKILAAICHTTNTRRTHLDYRLAVNAVSLEDLKEKLAFFLAQNSPQPRSIHMGVDRIILPDHPAVLAKVETWTAQTALQPISNGDPILENGASQENSLVVGLRQASGQPALAFLFPGQGTQYAGMGKRLYESQPVFRSSLDRCLEILAENGLDAPLGIPLLPLLMGYPIDRERLVGLRSANAEQEGDSEPGSKTLSETALAQLALFMVEYALAQMWISWGIIPNFVLGHGVGEYAAACLAGVFSLEDALKLVAARGRFMQGLPHDGSMAAVFASQDQIFEILANGLVEIAAVNGPSNLVISGETGAVEQALTELDQQGIVYHRLNVTNALQSRLMDPILNDFDAVARQIDYHPTKIKLVSNLTGLVMDITPDAAYWRQHLRNPIQFYQGMQTLASAGVRFFLEAGPKWQVSESIKDCFPDTRLAWFASLQPNQSDWDTVSDSLAGFYAAGFPVNWSAISDTRFESAGISALQFPTYPFQRERHWFGGIVSGDRMRLSASGFQSTAIRSNPINLLSAYPQWRLSSGDSRDDLDLLSDTGSFKMAENTRGERLLGSLITPPGLRLPVYQFASKIEFQEMLELGFFSTPGNFAGLDPVTSLLPGSLTVGLNGGIFQEMALAALFHSGLTGDRVLATRNTHPGDGLQPGGMIPPHDETTLDEIYFEQVEFLPIDPADWLPPTLESAREIGFYTQLTPLEELQARFEIFVDTTGGWRLLWRGVIHWRVSLVARSVPNLAPEVSGLTPDDRRILNLSSLEPAGEFTAETILLAPTEERLALLERLIRIQLGQVLRMDPARIGRELSNDRPIQYLGLDSIMAIELKNLIERNLRVHLAIAALLKGPTIASLSAQILNQIETVENIPGVLAPSIMHGEEGGGARLYPLSYGQRAMWFQHQMAPESVFNPVNAVRIHSPVDVTRLEQTIQLLARRHPSLRTTFINQDGEPYQRILPVDSGEDAETDINRNVFFQHLDASGWNAEQLQKQLNAQVEGEFDLEIGPLFRVVLFSLAENEHILVLAAHHIITDLWSLAILINELAVIYSALIPGKGNLDWRTRLKQAETSLPMPSLTYPDYVAWQKEYLSGTTGEQLWNYWSERLKGELPVLDLPTDRPRPSIQTYHGASRSIFLSQELTQKLQRLTEQSGVTLYMTLLSAFKILLYRYSGQEDLIVGTPTTGRDHAGLDEIVGYFVNPIALRTHLKADLKFSDFLQQVSQTVVEALDHQDYPFALLVEKLKPERDPSRLPISQVMFILQQAQRMSQTDLLNQDALSQFAVSMDGLRMELAGLQVESLSFEIQKAQMDLTMIMAEMQGGLGASMTFNTDLYNGETIERLLQHFRTLLEGIVENPDQTLGFLPLLTPAEYERLVFGLNQTDEIIWPDLPAQLTESGSGREFGLCVHRLFEAQVQRNPQATAVVFVDGKLETSLTYSELNRKANRLAHHLQALGVGPDSIVGVCVERSLEMIIGLLAVLKAGGAYLPMDPASPTDRLAFMIQDAKIDVLLSQSHLVEKLPTISAQLIYLDRHWENMVREILARIGKDAPQGDLEANPVSVVQAHNLAYIIYTSGSTGRSKGVLLEHLGLSNLVWAQIRGFRITPQSRELQFASFSFDASLSEIFTALLGGASLYLTRREILLSISDLIKFFQEQKISVVTLPPSVLAMMPALAPEELPHLKTIVSAGEALTPEIALRWAPGRIFLNAYGPTESTIGPTYFEIDGNMTDLEGLSELLKSQTGLGRKEDLVSSTVPIGRPISNVRIYLLDKLKQPVPVGMAGEIYIGGYGVARGYLNRPELTADKFVENPFLVSGRDSIPAGDRLYRTGDLARWLPDGNIEFLGRVDYQVKLRGFRIELEEIETVLSQHELVQQTAVVVRGNQADNRRLVAYVVPEAGMPLSFNDLRNYLRQYLPDYMIPSIFVIMDAFPQTTSGKVDRKALPDVNGARPDLESAYVPPQTEVERIIAKIWQEILNVEKVGLNDNFFDLGGHSLLMFKAHTRLQEAFGRTFSMVELFRYPTVSALSEYLGKEPQDQPTFQKSQERADQQKDAMKRQVDRMRELANTRAAAAKQAAMKRVNQPGRPGPRKPGDPA